MADPTLVVRVAANLSEMKANLTEGVSQIETYSSALRSATSAFDGSRIVSQASAAAAAIQNAGGVTALTSAEMAKANAIFTDAAAKLQLMGQGSSYSAQQFTALAAATRGANESASSLGSSWVARIAEGMLLRDAIREVITAVKDLADFFPELALRGAVVNDVEESFRRLSTQAGLTSDALLSTLRNATHGTIDDFTLMQRTTQDLAAGLNLTDAQFGTLAQGAYALAKATGGDVKSALDSMSDAMVTGRTKAVALLTGKIDLKAAEEDFAESLGGTTKELTAEGKLEADRVAILAAVQLGLARVGDQTDSLKDRVDQGKTSWSNFEDELGKSIATSKVLEAGMDGVRDSLAQAFGNSQQATISGLTNKINDALISIVGFSQAGVTGGGFLVTEYYAVNKVFGDLAQIVSGDALAFEYLALGVAKMGAATSSSSAAQQRYADDVSRIQGNISTLLDTMAARGRALQADDAAQAGVAATTAKYNAILQDLIDKMKAAAAGTTDFVGPINNEASAHTAAGAAAEKHTEFLKQTAGQLLELTKLEDDYAATAVARSGTTNDVLTANINKTYANLIAQLTAAGKYSDDISIQLAKNWGQALSSVGVDIAAIQKASTAQLQENFDNAVVTLNAAMGRVDASRLQPFIDKVNAARDALHPLTAEVQANADAFDRWNAKIMGMGTTLPSWNRAVMDMGTVVAGGAVQFNNLNDAISAANAGLDASKIKVVDLSGAVSTLADAIKKFDGGNSITYDLSTDAGIDYFNQMNPGASTTWSKAQIEAFIQNGGTLQQLEAKGVINVYAGLGTDPNLPHFAGGVSNFAGGLAMVGERGPEVVNLPMGSTVYSTGTGPSGTGGYSITIAPGAIVMNYPFVNDPRGRQEVATFVGDAIMAKLRSQGTRFPGEAG